jgi:hypothetical protein
MQNTIQVSKPKSMFIGFLLVLTVTLLFSCSKNSADVPNPANEGPAAASRSEQSSNDNIIHAVPFETTLFIPCANGGAGENVILSGFTNFVYRISWTDHGFTSGYHENVHEVKGVGAISGEKFTASGGINGTVMGSWVNEQWIGILNRQMRIIGQNTSFTVKYKSHITVISDGTVVINNIDQTADCN